MEAVFEDCITLLARECNMLHFKNTKTCSMIFVSLSLNFCQVIDVSYRRYIFIGMHESGSIAWHSLIKPFDPGLWLASVLCLLTLSAFLCLTEKFFQRCGAELEPDFSFLQSLFCVFSAFCSQGKEESTAMCKSGSVVGIMMIQRLFPKKKKE